MSRALVALVFLGVVVTGASAAAQPSTTTGSTTTTGASSSSNGITRTDLGSALPANAPGQELYLQRVTIAPGAKLPEHFHQGTQVAHIIAGDNTAQMAETMGIARSTARTHVQNVLAKLGVHSRLQAATAMFAASLPDHPPGSAP